MFFSFVSLHPLKLQLRPFLNLLQAILHFNKQQLPFSVTCSNHSNKLRFSHFIIYLRFYLKFIKKFYFCYDLSHIVGSLSARERTKWICLARAHVKHDKHYLVSQPFSHAQQCFGLFLIRTARVLAVFASSLGSTILVLGAATILW